jgi:hypothetical protein
MVKFNTRHIDTPSPLHIKHAKRPRTIWIDNSDEESSPIKANKKPSQGSPTKRMKVYEPLSGKQGSLQEQRRLLPISQGIYNLYYIQFELSSRFQAGTRLFKRYETTT